MAQNQDQERTEQATPKKRQDARKKGNVAQSREVSSVFILLSATGVLLFSASWMFGQMRSVMTEVFAGAGTLRLEIDMVPNFALDMAKAFIVTLSPVLAALVAAAFAGNLVQVGFLFSAEPLSPKLSKLDPIQGMKKLFSLRSLAELVKSLIKILCMGAVAYFVLKGEMSRIPALMQLEVGQILAFVGRVAFDIALYSSIALLVLALLDYAFQRWRHEEDLKMTKQEVKEERKQQEGDPLVRSRIRRLQSERARHRMMAAVPEADAVITNPTHLAVALKYDQAQMDAPRVTAKGAGRVAARIREIAQESGVPLVEDKPLARALFRSAEIGDAIPFELYQSVAEILAYVYRLKGRGQGA